MNSPDAAAVRAALAAIPEPSGGAAADIVAAGRVKGLTVNEGRVGFVLELKPGETPEAFEPMRAAAEAAAAALPGVSRVIAVLTAHSEAPSGGPAPHQTAQQGSPAQAHPQAQRGRFAMEGVAAIVAVASGKGGVGKSTVAANLACALAARGLKVGLLDADVYGPSAPILFGLEDARPTLDENRRIVPPEAFGVKVMSMGFLAGADEAMIWRGPMVMGAIAQLLEQVAWAPLDVLVIDQPPGTGDAQLTLAQRAPISGAVIVSTPQALALADVRRGIEMFAKVHVPVLGVVENMSAATDPNTGAVFAPFGAGGAKEAAHALGVPFLDAHPLDPALAEASDRGLPPAAVAPEGPAGKRFSQLAEAVLAALEAGGARAAPEIVFE
jgi:ATP-binding protein involved in chromosome partitioning